MPNKNSGADEIRKSIDEINSKIAAIITEELDKQNPDELTGKLSELANLIPSSAKALSMAELLYNQKVDEIIANQLFSELSATDKRWYVQGKTAREAALVTYTERLNKGLTHSLDAIRSILSYTKAELENLKNM